MRAKTGHQKFHAERGRADPISGIRLIETVHKPASSFWHYELHIRSAALVCSECGTAATHSRRQDEPAVRVYASQELVAEHSRWASRRYACLVKQFQDHILLTSLQRISRVPDERTRGPLVHGIYPLGWCWLLLSTTSVQQRYHAAAERVLPVSPQGRAVYHSGSKWSFLQPVFLWSCKSYPHKRDADYGHVFGPENGEWSFETETLRTQSRKR